MIQKIKGFKDILPEDIGIWQKVESVAKSIFENFGFSEIRLPVIERSELFKKSIGENTDIVEKEMYTFADRKGELITLRPEATASVVRSYIQNKMYAKEPERKLYTIGPMFRRERPQKGRYRQFYQINAEVFGIKSPLIDAQILLMLTTLFEKLEVLDTVTHLNSLGCPKCRPDFRKALIDFFKPVLSELCKDCIRRINTNPLRVLDCKCPSCKKAVENAPIITDYLCDECETHFFSVVDTLKSQNIPFELDTKLVRGLDYYTRTTFEIQTSLPGAQSAVAGGGRYDELVKMLGGPDQPAIGFAIGFDRLVEIIAAGQKQQEPSIDIFIAALGEKSNKMAYKWICELNLSGIKAEMDFSDKSLKSQMRKAGKLNAMYVAIMGENELNNGSVVLRNMKTKNQELVLIDNFIKSVKDKKTA